MTGYDIYKRVCSHLGYDPQEENEGVLQRTEEFLVQIGYDLRLNIPKGMSKELNLTPSSADALVYGIVMMEAVSRNDSGHALMFNQLYNAKRMAFLKETSTREDVLPNLSSGGM